MTIESTRRLRAWSRFWLGAVALAVAALLVAACSGSSSRSGPPAPGGSGRASGPTTSPTVTTPNRGTTPGPPPARAVAVPRSIDATGRVDDTKTLQAFIDKVPNGRVIQFRHGGRYRVDGTLFLRNRRSLTVDGQGALVFAKTRGGPNRAEWWIKSGSQITFRNLSVRGANPRGGVSKGAYVRKLETQHGFRFEGVNGIELDHVRVTDVYGDFVYLGRDKKKRPCRNVWIHDSTFLRNGRQGIAVTSATNVIIERNTFNDTRRSTVDLEPNSRSWRVSNVFVLHNTVGKGRLLFVASHGQGPVDNVVISGNRLLGHPLTIDVLPPGTQRRSNWVVTDNVSNTTVRTRPMRFAGIDGLVVSGNTQRVTGKQSGVVFNGDCGARVSNNQFGSGVVTQHGARCAAALTVPKQPLILGRGEATTTTTAPPVTAPRGSTTTRPQPGGAPSAGGGSSSTGWIAGIAAALVLLALALLALGRRRRRPSTDDSD